MLPEMGALLQQKSLHIGKDKARVKRAGTVNVPDATFAIDEKHAQCVVKRSLWIGGVRLFVHGLIVSDKNRS